MCQKGEKGVRFIYSDFAGLLQPRDPISIQCLRSIQKINLTPFILKINLTPFIFKYLY